MKFPVIALLVTLLAVGGQACDADGLLQCLTDFTNTHPEIANVYTVGYTEQQLDAVCGATTAFRDCATPALTDCSAEVRRVFDSVWNTVEYICSEESRQVLEDNKECFAKTELENDIMACVNDFSGAQGGTEELQCDATKTFAKCAVDAIESNCGSNAADWYQGLVNDALKPVGEIINCDITGGAPTVRISVMTFLAALGLSSLVA